jgi:hypothetical protein
MRDGQYRLLWTGVSDSKKMKEVKGDKIFRLGCHLVFSWLLPWCDDDGRMPGEPLKILANVVPNEGLSIKEIELILSELHRVKLIIWYNVEGERFIQVLNWEEYQRIRKDRYHPSIYPPCQPSDNQQTTNGPQFSDLSLTPSPSLTPTKEYMHTCETFWTAYPKRHGKKVGKKECFDFIKYSIESTDYDKLIAAAGNYAKSEDVKKGFAKDPIRFLRKDFWKDWIEPPKREPDPTTPATSSQAVPEWIKEASKEGWKV